YLHKNNIVHRNLQPQNILIDKNGIPKLIDYGISMEEYAENFTNQPFNVYSVGCILWQIDTRKEVPWSELSNPNAILKTTLQPSKNCPQALKELIVKCVQHEPKKR